MIYEGCVEGGPQHGRLVACETPVFYAAAMPARSWMDPPLPMDPPEFRKHVYRWQPGISGKGYWLYWGIE